MKNRMRGSSTRKLLGKRNPTPSTIFGKSTAMGIKYEMPKTKARAISAFVRRRISETPAEELNDAEMLAFHKKNIEIIKARLRRQSKG